MSDKIEARLAALEDAYFEIAAANEFIVRELLFELMAKGILEEWDIAKIVLRAETAASIAKEASQQDDSPEGADDTSSKVIPFPLRTLGQGNYFDALEQDLERRLALKPSLYVLRQEVEKWHQKGQKGPDPRDSLLPIPADA